jgi:hypothetical protein
LHAITVHDGSAEGGHYFTFIKDHYQSIWRKFNDIRVTTVDEKDVFLQSVGGHGGMTAYWIVYVSEDLLNQYQKLNINSFDPLNETNKGHVYGRLIASDVSKQIEEENANLIALIQDNKNLELAKQVTTLYE